MIRDTCMKNARIVLKERRLGFISTDEWTPFVGTGGVYLSISIEDEVDDSIMMDVTIMVDPSIAHKEKGFITETIDNVTENS